nr:urease accessory protein UreD [Microbacterium ureisolvens]
MLLPGDEVHIRVAVGAGCTLHLIDIGGLVVYGRPDEIGDPSQWHARIDLAPRAHVTWEGLPTVITDAGSLARSLTITLADQSSAVVRETLVLGRTGERGGRLTADTDVSDPIGPLVRETLEVRGDAPVPGILGRNRVMDSILAVGDPTLTSALTTDLPGTTRLEFERAGTAVRYLGDAAHDSPLDDVRVGTRRLDAEPHRAA